MWVLPKNYQLSSAFAADMVESKEDLILQGLAIEQSLMWRSKPSPLKTWCRRWKKDSFLQHLFTRTLCVSQHKSFETKLTLSLADIHVRHFHKQEKDKEKTTPDTYGLTSENTWKQLDLIEYCSKTSKDTYRLDSQQSLATWKKMVTTQRGEYSARVKLAHTIRENEYSSWPTVRVSSSHGASQNEINKGNPKKRLETEVIVRNWPTATVFDATGGGYPTEIVNGQYKSKHSKDPDSPWYGAKLADAVKVNWPTPATRDYKGANGYESTLEKLADNKQAHMNQLPNAIMVDNGGPCHLNPDWVEKLMGVPTGWTALDGDSNEWQNNWSGDWEGDTPRTTDIKKNRTDRIRMLGNGVVPATAAKAWTVLSARLNKGD